MTENRTSATASIPDGYRVERRELDGDVPRVRFDVVEARTGRLVDSVRVRLWAGEWHVQRSPTAGIPLTADDAMASAYGLVEAVQAARRGNEGGRP